MQLTDLPYHILAKIVRDSRNPRLHMALVLRLRAYATYLRENPGEKLKVANAMMKRYADASDVTLFLERDTLSLHFLPNGWLHGPYTSVSVIHFHSAAAVLLGIDLNTSVEHKYEAEYEFGARKSSKCSLGGRCSSHHEHATLEDERGCYYFVRVRVMPSGRAARPLVMLKRKK